MQKWSLIDVDDALELLSPHFTNLAVRQYAVSRLREADDEVCIPGGGREGGWDKVEMNGERMGGMNEWRVGGRKERMKKSKRNGKERTNEGWKDAFPFPWRHGGREE